MGFWKSGKQKTKQKKTHEIWHLEVVYNAIPVFCITVSPVKTGDGNVRSIPSYIHVPVPVSSLSFSCATEECCTTTQRLFGERDDGDLHFCHLASVLKALSLPKQPIQIGWLCPDTQILFHLPLIVQTVYLKRNPICLQSEHSFRYLCQIF